MLQERCRRAVQPCTNGGPATTWAAYPRAPTWHFRRIGRKRRGIWWYLARAHARERGPSPGARARIRPIRTPGAAAPQRGRLRDLSDAAGGPLPALLGRRRPPLLQHVDAHVDLEPAAEELAVFWTGRSSAESDPSFEAASALEAKILMPWELRRTRAMAALGDVKSDEEKGGGGAEDAGEHRVPGAKKHVRPRVQWRRAHEADYILRARPCAWEPRDVRRRIDLRGPPNQGLGLEEYYVDIARARGFAPPPPREAAPAAAAPARRNRQES